MKNKNKQLNELIQEKNGEIIINWQKVGELVHEIVYHDIIKLLLEKDVVTGCEIGSYGLLEQSCLKNPNFMNPMFFTKKKYALDYKKQILAQHNIYLIKFEEVLPKC